MISPNNLFGQDNSLGDDLGLNLISELGSEDTSLNLTNHGELSSSNLFNQENGELYLIEKTLNEFKENQELFQANSEEFDALNSISNHNGSDVENFLTGTNEDKFTVNREASQTPIYSFQVEFSESLEPVSRIWSSDFMEKQFKPESLLASEESPDATKELAISLPGEENQSLKTTLSFISRDADFTNEVGLFLVDDETGRIGNLTPDDEGYAAAALSPQRKVLAVNKEGQTVNQNLNGGSHLGSYLIQNSTTEELLAHNPDNKPHQNPVAFFNFTTANLDNFDHVNITQVNETTIDLAWEDLTGGGDQDFNDAVLRVSFEIVKDEGTGTIIDNDLPPKGLNFNLANDTGIDNRDNITSDPTIEGAISNIQGNITLQASLSGAAKRDLVDLSELLQPDGSFSLYLADFPRLFGVNLDEGTYALQLMATDRVTGDMSSRELTFTYDATAPTLNLITPVEGSNHSNTSRLTGFVTEASLVEYSLDGGEQVALSLDSNNQFDAALIDTRLSAGSHSTRITATDLAGNLVESTVSFTVNDEGFLIPDHTNGWGVNGEDGIILGEGDSYVVETSRTITLGLDTNEAGEEAGTRSLSFEVETRLDDSDNTATIEDQLLVYLVDPHNPNQTLLDNGTPGSAVFSLAGERADFTPGLVSFDGATVTIDVTSLKEYSEGQLVFQLLNQDGDTGNVVRINNFNNVTELEGRENPILPEDDNLATAGASLDLTSLNISSEVETIINNVRFDSDTGTYQGEVVVSNQGEAIGRNVAVVLENLPAGVELVNPSGVDSNGNPYLNLRPGIGTGGLKTGDLSDGVAFTINNPHLEQFSLTTKVLVGSPNVAPIFAPIDNLTVVPGSKLSVQLNASDGDGDNLTYRWQAEEDLPTGMLAGDGTLKFNPTPADIGSYQFTVIASDGVESVSQNITLDVVADPITTTRVSGVIENVEQEPLGGVVIEIGDLQTVTDELGEFTLETVGELPSDTLFVRGEGIEGDKVYPFIAEKLPLVLGQEVYSGFNNVIDRPIYLPAIDVASGQVINPAVDNTVTTENIPGAAVFVAANSLDNQAGEQFTGILSITAVPNELTPAALPPNVNPDLVVTIQPGEMEFLTPAPLSLPNLGGYAPGTEMDLWSINPTTGDFDNVGVGRVSDDGAVVETIEGGIRNSSWHFFAPAPENQRNPEDDVRNEDKRCPDCQVKGGLTSEVEFHSGAVIETHELVTYSSNGQSQGITLTYDSYRADPREIVHFGYDDINGSRLDPSSKLVAELTIHGEEFDYQVPGLARGEYGLDGGEHFWSLPRQDGNISAALQADLRNLASGKYSYSLTSGVRRLVNDQFLGSSSTSNGEIIHVNSIDSAFGSGWSIAGLQEIVENSDGSIILIDGDGEELVFDAPATAGEAYFAPPGDFSILEKLANGTFRRTTKDQMVYEFDTNNKLVSVTDRNGNQTSHVYDAEQRIIKIVDEVGLETNFTYNSEGKVNLIVDPANRETSLEYDENGNLIRITDPDGSSRTWSYDEDRHMVSEIDQRGNTEQAFYDEFGRAEKAIRKDGSTIQVNPLQTQGLFSPELTINPSTAPLALVETETPVASYADGNGNVTKAELDRAGQNVSSVDGGGSTGTVERNEDNLITVQTDARGNLTEYTYDDAGNIITIQDSLSLANSVGETALIVNGSIIPADTPEFFTYVYSTVRLQQILENNEVVTTTSDNVPQDLSRYDQVWDIRYKNSSAISTAEKEQYLNFLQTGGNLFLVGENSNFATRNDSILNFIEEAGGGQLNFVEPSSTQQILSPFDSPNLISNGEIPFYSPGGVTNAGLGQFITADSNNYGTSIAFTEGDLSNATSGELIAIFDIGFFEDATNNSDNRNLLNNLILSNLTQPDNSSAFKTFTYDPTFNQVTSYTDELGRITLNEIDSNNGNLLSTTLVVGEVGGDDDIITRYTYTAAGLIDTETAPLGRVTNYDYDLFGRVITMTYGVGTAESATVSYEYDLIGNQTAVIDENGNRTEFEYDAKNRLIKTIEADPDGAGELTSPISSFKYDEAGNLVEFIDESGNITQQEYDELNRKLLTIDALSQESSSEYDGAGNIIAVIDEEGRRTENLYDSRNRLIATIDPEGNETRFRYDTEDNLVSVIDKNGNGPRYIYDARNRVIGELDGLGEVTNYIYDLADNLVSVIDKNGNQTALEYDELDRPIKQINAKGDEYISSYDKNSNLIATTDELGRVTNFSYDNRDRLISTTDAENGVALYQYDGVGNLLAFTDEENRTTNYTYDALNRQTLITDPLNYQTSSTYDGVGNLTSITDAENRTTNFTYDKLNRQTVITNPLGDTFTTEYDAVGNVVAVTDELGRITNFAYDERDLPTSITDGEGNITTTEYDAVGNVSSVTDAEGRITSYEYDKLYRLIKEIDAHNESVTYSYDGVGNLLSVTDQLNRITTYTYDELNRQTELIAPLDRVTAYEYDAVGNLITETDALGRKTGYKYDRLNRQIEQIEAKNQSSTYSYDGVGNLLSVTDELDRTTSYTYDKLNRQLAVTDPLLHTTNYSYDGVGNLLSVTDPLNLTTSYSYDELDRQVEQIDAEERTTSYSYDAVGNLLSITDPEANTTSYTYDKIDRLLRDTNQLGDTESYQYDRVGNRVKQTDRNGREIVYNYDNLNRNTSEVWLDEHGNAIRTANFNYDAASQLVTADDPDSSYTYDYDLAGRLIEVDNAGTPGVPNVVLNYGYDAADNLTTVTDTVDGIVKGTETFTYDELDRVTSITQSGDGIADKRVDYGYDAASQMTSSSRYSDLDGTNKVAQSNYTFDEAGRLTNLIHLQDATTLAAFAWVYDAANRITQYTSPDGTSDYNYDDTDQLLDANHDFQSNENYRYDENGNRTNPGYVTGENNRLLADRYYSYEYDSEGNRVSRTEIATGEVTEYQWDYRNRLVGVVVSDSDGNVTARHGYNHDVFDRRIAKSVDRDGDGVGEAVVERFVHDGDHIALTFDGDGNETERFFHGVRIDEVLAQENAGGGVLWGLSDHQGSVRLLMDSQGNVVNNITYDSFGNVTVETNAGNSFRFTYTGREFDNNTGQYYYRSRPYDSLTGGFIQEDKIGFAGGDVNLSRYVGNSPLIYTDPYGEAAITAGFIIGVVVTTLLADGISPDGAQTPVKPKDFNGSSVDANNFTPCDNSLVLDNVPNLDKSLERARNEIILGGLPSLGKGIIKNAPNVLKTLSDDAIRVIDDLLPKDLGSIPIPVIGTLKEASKQTDEFGELLVNRGLERLKEAAPGLGNATEDLFQHFFEAINDNSNSKSVGNMNEFFGTDFGSSLSNSLKKTSKQFQGQSIYEVNKKLDHDILKQGDKLYLDNLHKDHLEVFDKKGRIKAVINLDGTKNVKKTQAAIQQGRSIKKLL